jgi:tRNA threonylcarbamoyladenosine dehydratase
VSTLVNWPGANAAQDDPDLERRFGGLRRLYGDAAYLRLRAARVAVVGLGGVGSWAAEALARSGVHTLVLIDLDHVSESNINRQVQALGATVGQSKALALRERIADIHPGCAVHAVEEFADDTNWPALLPCGVDVVIDACDQVRAKLALAAWALHTHSPLVVVGAAGGKRQAHGLQAGDLAEATHDPLLASLRNRLRREHGAARRGPIGVRCVYSRESVVLPSAVCDLGDASVAGEDRAVAITSDLNCHGYGSSVTVTASFGFIAAGEALEIVARQTQVTAPPTTPQLA